MLKEALYYEQLENNKIKCHLCPFNCRVKEGAVARCMGRQNIAGSFYAINYAKSTSLSIDPIEKKPLFHFYPTSKILSIAANSCNLGCTFCQNWSISQVSSDTSYISTDDIISYAKRCSAIGLAYTYSEPLMWYEYVLDTSKKVKKAGLKNVLVTNGTINKEPLTKLLPYIDAINIDLKGINERFYKKVCKGLLKPVLDNIRLIKSMANPPLLEITNLIIPGLNDSEEDIQGIIDFVASIDINIPLHFSSYHPDYKLEIEQTPTSILAKAYGMARRKLCYVYIGNASIPGASNTYCPSCKSLLIKRDYYTTLLQGLDGSSCRSCGRRADIAL